VFQVSSFDIGVACLFIEPRINKQPQCQHQCQNLKLVLYCLIIMWPLTDYYYVPELPLKSTQW